MWPYLVQSSYYCMTYDVPPWRRHAKGVTQRKIAKVRTKTILFSKNSHRKFLSELARTSAGPIDPSALCMCWILIALLFWLCYKLFLFFFSRSRAGTVLGVTTNLSWLLSVLVHPYMPGVSEEIQRQLQVGSFSVQSSKVAKCVGMGWRTIAQLVERWIAQLVAGRTIMLEVSG